MFFAVFNVKVTKPGCLDSFRAHTHSPAHTRTHAHERTHTPAHSMSLIYSLYIVLFVIIVWRFRSGFSSNKLEYNVQVQLRFCLVDSTTRQPDAFPSNITVKVNGVLAALPVSNAVHIHNKVTDGKPVEYLCYVV